MENLYKNDNFCVEKMNDWYLIKFLNSPVSGKNFDRVVFIIKEFYKEKKQIKQSLNLIFDINKLGILECKYINKIKKMVNSMKDSQSVINFNIYLIIKAKIIRGIVKSIIKTINYRISSVHYGIVEKLEDAIVLIEKERILEEKKN